MIKKKQKLVVTRVVEKSEPMKIEIHNMNLSKPYRAYDVKCDRSSPLGSIFYLQGDEANRDDVCDSYEQWFNSTVLYSKQWSAYQELMRLLDLYKTHRKLRIFCWCKPKRCHCETIKEWLEENV